MTHNNPHHKHSDTTSSQHRTAVVLVNDLAPGANKLNWVEACSRGFGPGVDVKMVRVSGFDAVRKAASAAADEGAWAVISVGGDGTSNAIINGIGDRPTRICALPAGTSNTVPYVLGQSRDIAENVARLGQFVPVDLDAMRVNGQLFSVLGAAGWIADAADTYNQFRAKGSASRMVSKLLGTPIYTLFFLSKLIPIDSLGGPCHISYIDAHDKTRKELDIDLQNLLLLGPPMIDYGRYKFFPEADMADGVLDILLFRRTNRAGLFKSLFAMQDGSHLKMPQVSTLQVLSFELTTPKNMPFNIDGEAMPHCDKYVIDIAPAPLRFLAPPGERPGTRRMFGST